MLFDIWPRAFRQFGWHVFGAYTPHATRDPGTWKTRKDKGRKTVWKGLEQQQTIWPERKGARSPFRTKKQNVFIGGMCFGCWKDVRPGSDGAPGRWSRVCFWSCFICQLSQSSVHHAVCQFLWLLKWAKRSFWKTNLRGGSMWFATVGFVGLLEGFTGWSMCDAMQRYHATSCHAVWCQMPGTE